MGRPYVQGRNNMTTQWRECYDGKIARSCSLGWFLRMDACFVVATQSICDTLLSSSNLTLIDLCRFLALAMCIKLARTLDHLETLHDLQYPYGGTLLKLWCNTFGGDQSHTEHGCNG